MKCLTERRICCGDSDWKTERRKKSLPVNVTLIEKRSSVVISTRPLGMPASSVRSPDWHVIY